MAYAYDSKSYDRKVVWVRVPPQALIKKLKNIMVIKRSIRKIKQIAPLDGIRKTREEAKKTIITLILSGFSLVAALAWNDAIQGFFNEIFPKEGISGLIGKFIYAVIVTLIIVVASLQLKKIIEEPKE